MALFWIDSVWSDKYVGKLYTVQSWHIQSSWVELISVCRGEWAFKCTVWCLNCLQAGDGLKNALTVSGRNLGILRMSERNLRADKHDKWTAHNVDNSVLKLRKRRGNHRWVMGGVFEHSWVWPGPVSPELTQFWRYRICCMRFLLVGFAETLLFDLRMTATSTLFVIWSHLSLFRIRPLRLYLLPAYFVYSLLAAICWCHHSDVWTC